MSERQLLARRVRPPRDRLRAILHNAWLYERERAEVRVLLDRSGGDCDVLASEARRYESLIAERRDWMRNQ